MKHSRLRKAWLIKHDEFDATVWAETGSKATYQLYEQMEYQEGFRRFLDRTLTRRHPERDIILPDRHPLSGLLDPRILSCVVHAYGGTGLKAGYREHFYTNRDDPMPKAAYYHGLFTMHRVSRSYAGSDDMVSYILTDLGKNVARGEAETYPRW